MCLGRKIREQRDLRRKLVFRKLGITSGELLGICTPPGDELHTGRRAVLRGRQNSDPDWASEAISLSLCVCFLTYKVRDWGRGENRKYHLVLTFDAF